jgi:phosphonate transport system permease protein
VIGLAILAIVQLEVSPLAIWNGLGRLGDFVVLMFPPSYGTEARLVLYLKSLAETLGIALLGTLGAAVLAFPLAFLAARNVVASRLIQFTSRRFFDSIRGVDTLIWALIWINVVGLGPFAGVLAILTSDFGTFGKLFSEAIETSDKRPVEGVVASGGGHVHAIRFGILPQVMPLIASQILYYIESNTRSATIIGIVGAGGIGMHLSEQIRTLEWQHVSFLILLVLITVGTIDFISARLRLAIIGERRA